MARPYSQDLRDRVVSSVASGRTCRATAALFRVSVASVVKWSQRWRASGSTAAKQVAELAERGTPASYGAVWRFFKHEGITFKKNAARQRAGSRRHRSPPDPVEGASGPA